MVQIPRLTEPLSSFFCHCLKSFQYAITTAINTFLIHHSIL